MLISSQARVRACLRACANRVILCHIDLFAYALWLWPDSSCVVCLLQVSEVEMRGMLALETELSVEEILVYRDVAR